MAIAFDAGVSGGGVTSSGSTTTLSWTHTTGAGANAILVFAVMDDGSNESMSVTCNGTAMTSLGGIDLGGNAIPPETGFYQYVQLFLATTSVTASSGNAIVVTSSASLPSGMCINGGSMSFSGYVSHGTVATAHNVDTATVPANTSGNIIAGFISCGETITQAGAPATGAFLNNYLADGNIGMSAGAYAPATGSSVTITWSSAASGYCSVGVEMQGSAGPTITTTSLPEAEIGQAYSTTVQATGGTTPYTWSISSGSLPGWASLNSSTGVISGTPTGAPATTSFTVEVTDNASLTGTQPLSITTFNPIPATIPALPAIPGLSTPGAATPGDPGPAPSGPVTGPAFYPATHPVRSVIPAPLKLRGVYMGVGPKDLSFGTGQVQWSAGGPVKNPVPGPVSHQRTQPAQARIPRQPRLSGVYMGVGPKDLSFGTGQVQWSAGTPLAGPKTGPVFYPATSPCRARIPREAPSGSITGMGAGGAICGAINGNGFGNGSGSKGAPVNNPNPGPVFFQRRTPVRFTLPPWHPTAGRIGFNKGAAVQNPIHGPPVYPLEGPIRVRLPQLQPRAGRIYSNAGAPVRNPSPGPVFVQRTFPARAQHPLPPRGRVYASVLRKITLPSSGPAFIQANQVLRAKLPLRPLLRGRMASVWGAPVNNPTPGPVFRQAASPARTRVILPPRGRVYSNPGRRQLVHNGPVFFPAVQALRAKLPQQPLLRGRTSFNHGAPVQNPASGPVFIQAVSPARARIPQAFSKGRISSSPGAPVHNPTAGPVFRQATSPSRIRPSLPPHGRITFNEGAPVAVITTGPVFYPRNFARAQQPLPRRGICRAIRFYPVPSSPAPGPVFSPVKLVRAQFPPFSKGRISSNPGARNPAPPASGPVFVQRTSPVQAKAPFPRRGQCRFLRRCPLPVSPPATGPVFVQATTPARIRPGLPPKGRIGSNPGGPVLNPGPVTTGPRTFVRAQQPLPRRGICRAIRFYGVQANPAPGPVFIQATAPIRARFPLPPRGRIASSQGAPVRNPVPAVAFVQKTYPARIRPHLPPRGRISFNVGVPAHNPCRGPGVPAGCTPGPGEVPAAPQGQDREQSRGAGTSRRPSPDLSSIRRIPRSALGSRRTLPADGPTPTPGAPVRNPAPGPVFRPAVHPCRTLVPQVFSKGRIGSSPGGPVLNPPAPLYPLQHPVQARHPLPPTPGRIGSNPGSPVVVPGSGPRVYPAKGPVQARRPLPPHGQGHSREQGRPGHATPPRARSSGRRSGPSGGSSRRTPPEAGPAATPAARSRTSRSPP